MTSLTGKDEATLVEELHGVIFQLPGMEDAEGHPVYVTADEYLSGNVRKKLRQAEQAADADSRFRVNAEALKAVQPVDLTASEISVRLGATWLPLGMWPGLCLNCSTPPTMPVSTSRCITPS